jgi:hypothetical protein
MPRVRSRRRTHRSISPGRSLVALRTPDGRPEPFDGSSRCDRNAVRVLSPYRATARRSRADDLCSRSGAFCVFAGCARSASLKEWGRVKEMFGVGVQVGDGGGLCGGARRRRSRGQGWLQATPEGLGLDAGEERRRLEFRSLRSAQRWGSVGVGVSHPWSSRSEGGSAARLPRHPFADVWRAWCVPATTRRASSSSSTSPRAAGVMPITGSRLVVSETAHAAWAWARQRISPSRRP